MRYLFALLFLVSGISLFSQETGLSGTISDQQGKTVPFANLKWAGTSIGAVTDSTGAFEIKRPENTRSLIVSHVSYGRDTFEIESLEEPLNLVLNKDEKLEEVEVKGRKQSSSFSLSEPIHTQKITVEEMEKAACCSLAESFETNPSIDAVYSDAATGTQKIIMLGLAGKYMTIRREKLPFTNGIAAFQGLETFPGPWVSSISISKGVGSVTDGFESSTGQINVEVKKPDDPERMLLNVYFNEMSRTEINFWRNSRINNKLGTTTLLHGSGNFIRWDRNNDNFLDGPLRYNVNLMHRWKFNNLNGWMGQLGVNYIRSKKISGNKDFPFTAQPNQVVNEIYGINIENERWEAWGKTGYVFNNKKNTSLGFLANFAHQTLNSSYGERFYNAEMKSVYANLILNSEVSTPAHNISTGLSFRHELIDESILEQDFFRVEQVPGAFFEYTYKYREQWTVQAGLRGDYNSIFGFYATPRLHIRYNPTENTSFKIGAGRGQRTSTIITENMEILATNRAIQVNSDKENAAYGLSPEVSYNYGGSITQFFHPGGKEGSLVVEYFRTDFLNQVILDLENVRKAEFYNLNGRSFSNSFQVEYQQNIWRKFDARLAYRWYDVRRDYNGEGRLKAPFLSSHRLFLNLAYETGKTWKFDYTVTWTSPKRIPSTASNPEKYQVATESPDYFMMNAQITKIFKKRFELYLGIENILNFRQQDPIIASEEPNSQYFDSSLIWGPIFGRNTYIGFRYKL